MSWPAAFLLVLAGDGARPEVAAAQTAAPVAAADEKAVRTADDAFWRAFNACDAASMARWFSEDVEFYHDLTGLTRGRAATVASLLKGPCGTPGLHLRRALVDGSMRFQAIPGYGAMLTGEHLFHARQGDTPERPATLARFLVIWQHQAGGWAMTRIVSYDHRPPPYVATSVAIPLSPEKLKRYVGRYRTQASGDVDISLEEGELVLRSGSLRVTLAASTPDRFFARERDLRIVFQGDRGISEIRIEENGAVVARGVRVEPHR
ncbi:MAG: DUF4440 domain-containing protein [Sphingomonas sp.]|uniref:nuclear transport factor 2 family protein n=1 Tax=Sphingomonas sp. TaxID=28214 RepID=UPI001B023BB7|nr:DUF4440 domain-containing protein [Sphingomonas sp.]MBO9621649.1 DUF4440 domain-containing protein [Sphingomonas sp.]